MKLSARVRAAGAAVLLSTVMACGSGPSDYQDPSGGGGVAAPAGGDVRAAQALPMELVGRWNGGSNERGHWYYEFGVDGTYRAWPAYVDNPQILTGTAMVQADTLTLSNGGAPVTYRWSVRSGLLYLDGFSYVPA